MDKFTDKFFIFPIRVYDGGTDTGDITIPPDWIVGYARIPEKDLEDLHWYDGFSTGKSVKEVAQEGFDLTMVFHEVHGMFTCAWAREKFEQKLNEFMKDKNI